MWKKNEPAPASSVPRPAAPASAPEPRSAASSESRSDSRPASSAPAPVSGGPPAVIGASISVEGDITGQQDLVIEGRVVGGIDLRKNNVTVGQSGQVEANIYGKRICIEGQVKGDLFGEEVVILASGRVEGNATAPKVTLENGCNFRGSIDMQPGKEREAPKKPKPSRVVGRR